MGRYRGDIVRDALHRQLQRMRSERLRAQGMRPMQIWVLDVHSPPRHGQAFIDSVVEWPDAETI